MRWKTDGGPVSVAGKNPPPQPPLAKGMIMKAAVYHNFGGPEVLEVVEVPEPKMFADQVRIRIKAAALNPADLGFQAGAVDALVDSFFPVIPGWDVAGIVEETGTGTTGFKPGDEVIGFVRGAVQRYGSYAEQIAAARGASVISTASESNHDYLRSLGVQPVAYGDGWPWRRLTPSWARLKCRGVAHATASRRPARSRALKDITSSTESIR